MRRDRNAEMISRGDYIGGFTTRSSPEGHRSFELIPNGKRLQHQQNIVDLFPPQHDLDSATCVSDRKCRNSI